MVTCLQKSRAKLVGDESQAIQFKVSVDRLLGGDTHVYIYEGRRFLYSFQPEQGSLCALRCFLSYLFDLLKSQVPSVEELAVKERSSIIVVVSPFL